MVPSHFVSFFSVMGEGGAALLGLLFVAVSIRRATGAPKELAEAVVLADATLFALADGFIVSMAALHPQLSVGYVALGMSAVGVWWAIHGLIHLRGVWMKNGSGDLRSFRLHVVVPNLTGLLLNTGQIVAAIRLAIRPEDDAAMGLLATVLLGYYSIALLRAWALVGGAHYGPRAAFSEANRAPTLLALKQHHLPRWPHVRHGPRGPSSMTRPQVG
jgi:hypothetical protein